MALEDINWMLGIALMFSLALVMTFFTVRSTRGFFVWLTVFSGFVVWSGLVDLWVLILCVIVLVLILITEVRGSNQS